MVKYSFYHINFIFFIKNFIIFFLCNHYFVSAQTDSLEYPTGFREPTEKEIEWQKKNLINTVKVLPNKIALARMQNVDREIAVTEYKYFSEENLTQIGEEIVGFTGEDFLTPSAVEEEMSPADYLLPNVVDNTELPFFPGIGSQGSLGSCEEFSTIYYTLTHVTGLLRNWSSVEKIFSPAWTYHHNLFNWGGEHGGMLGILTYHGCATMDEFFYDGYDWKKWCTDADIWKNALSMRLSSCGKISYVSPDNAIAFNNLKQMLANGYILNFRTLVSNWSHTTVKDNINTYEDNKFSGELACRAVCGSSTIAGHAMTVVGYNDYIWIDINNNNVVDDGEEGAFKIANSWGTGWGNKGYIWFAYDALKKYSTIPGAPNTNRITGWRDNNEVYWLLPRKNDYKPLLLSEITLHHSKRAQIRLWLGVSNTNVTTPDYTWYPGVLQNAGQDYAFDGTTNPCDGSFAFDFTDMIAENNIDTSKILRWYIGIEDNAINDPATIKSFKLIDVFNGETELIANDLPVSIDNGIKYVFIDHKIGSNANKAPDVDIGEDKIIFHKDTLVITALVTDDNLPQSRILKYNWEILFNNNNATIINNNSITCQVIFKETGEYVLRCTVDDGEFKTSDDVIIYVSNLDLVAKKIDEWSYYRKIHFSGDYLLVGSGFDLNILNIEHKTNPVITGRYRTLNYDIYDIDATEEYAYVSNGIMGLTIINIINKYNPTYVNKYNGSVYNAKIKDNHVFLLEDANDELIILDVTNKYNLLKIAGLKLQGISTTSCLEIEDNFVYISEPFAIIDIYDILNPKIIHTNTTLTGSTLNISGEYIFIDDKIVNIKNPKNPVLINKFNIIGKCEFVQGNCAYISSDEGISVYDISNKQYPQKIGYYPIYRFIVDFVTGRNYDIYVEKDCIFTGCQGSPGLLIFKADLINTKPYVYIYADSISADTAQIVIRGIVTDDGSPTDSALQVYWTNVIQSGTVKFDDSTQINTKVSFYKNGRYVFKLNAYDGELSNSDTVIININMPLSIEKQPMSQTRCEGDKAYFTVKAHSNEAISYAWSRNGIPLVENERYIGVNSDSLIIDKLNVDDMGEISCLATVNSFKLESKKAFLNVHPVSRFNISESICEGESIIVGGETRTTTGTYYDTLSTIYGCDSIIITGLIVNTLPIVYLGNDTIIYTNDTIVLDAGNGYNNYSWSNGSNERSITISNLNVGDYEYSVEVINNKNCHNSDTITIHVVIPNSISKVFNSFGLNIYPNPNSGFLFIRSNVNIETELRIILMDDIGRVVFENTVDKCEANMEISLNLLNLKNGMYILRINNSDIVTIQKIIKY